jgi:transcriptional regulator with XRE-family HTH domain
MTVPKKETHTEQILNTLEIMPTRLKECRKSARLSQGQVAEYEGCTQQYISQLESGVNKPPVVELLYRMANRYQTSVDYMLGLTNDPTPASRRELSPAVREMRGLFEQLTPARQDEAMALMRAMLDNQNKSENT